MSKLRTAAQQALEAMDYMLNNGEWYQAQERADALRAALAEPAQEPVAWTTMPDAEDWLFISGSDDPNGRLQGEWTPLYTSPPQRKPLTGEEIDQIAINCLASPIFDPGWNRNLARAIERAHGIKENT